jgi:FlaA1/EpsC-like NDP-sugar epimerase
VTDLRRSLLGLRRGAKTGLLAAGDAVIVAFAFWFAHFLRLDAFFADRLAAYAWLILVLPLASVPAFRFLGTYRTVIRFMSGRAAWAIARAALASTAILMLIVLFARVEGVPRSVYLLHPMLLFLGMLGVRLVARAWLPSGLALRPRSRKPVIVYGAGSAGVQLVRMLEQGDGFRVVAFLDDDPARQGSEIFGVPVRAPERLEALVERFQVNQVLLALPSATRARRVEIIEALERARVRVRTVPALPDILSGAATLDELRDVPVDDLLGRDPVPPDERLLDRCVAGRCVLVTGAGGSIGSELARQALARRPTRLVLFERSEYALYRIERELTATAASARIATRIEAVLGDVLDEDRLGVVLRTHGVETVYHAAAYKHVPMVEANPVEGVRNNVLGTLAAVRASGDAGIERFVLVSTDKAVRPTNVMGASKRVAELVLQALAAEGGRTRLAMVRFGNVLDSSGSVVPLFREQIRIGGPVTVTDSEVIRYFMTLREAAQLVMQAGALGGDGEVYVLDMGEPVRILDLARRMIRLAGRSVRDADHPDGEIEIAITGLRPGEKLYEELLIDGDAASTDHARIMRAREAHLPWATLHPRLESLRSLCRDGDAAGLRALLAELVDGYAGTERADLVATTRPVD